MKLQITWAVCAAALLVGIASPREVAVAQDTLPAPDLAPAGDSELPQPVDQPEQPILFDLNRHEEQLADVPPAQLGVTFDPRFRDAAVVRSVMRGSPAEQARLQEGDAIEAINGRGVSSYEDVIAAIDAMRPGDVIDIDFSRRITGRTQAVLGGDAGGRRQVVGYGAGRSGNQSAEATLPNQQFESQNRARTPLPRQAERDDRSRREDSEARDGAEGRDDERGLRNRGLLRWRRN